MEIKLIIIMLISIWYTYSWIRGQKLFILFLLPKVNKYINLVFGPFLPNGNSYWIQQIYTRSTYPICTSVQRILISVWVIVKIHQIIFFFFKKWPPGLFKGLYQSYFHCPTIPKFGILRYKCTCILV